MSRIKVSTNEVFAACSLAKSQLGEIQNAKMEIAWLQSQLSGDVKSRYDISGQIHRLMYKFDALQGDLSNIICTIELGANQYHHTENQLVIKAHQVGRPAHLAGVDMASILGWIDDGRGDFRPYQNPFIDEKIMTDADLTRVEDILNNMNIDDALNYLDLEGNHYTEVDTNLLRKILNDFKENLSISEFLKGEIIESTGEAIQHADETSMSIVSLLNGLSNMGRSNTGSTGFIMISPTAASRNVKILASGNKIATALSTPMGKLAVPVVGGIIDFGMMVYDGDAMQDAAVKAVVHTAISAGLTKAGAALGSALGTFIPIPGVGTAIGAVTGAAIGTVVSFGANAAFDAVYDHKDEIAKVIGDGVNQVTQWADKQSEEFNKGVSEAVDSAKSWLNDFGDSWRSGWRSYGTIFG